MPTSSASRRSHLPNTGCSTGFGRHEREIVVDPIILGELRFGILLLSKGKKRTALERWFDAGVQRLNCLPWEAKPALGGQS